MRRKLKPVRHFYLFDETNKASVIVDEGSAYTFYQMRNGKVVAETETQVMVMKPLSDTDYAVPDEPLYTIEADKRGSGEYVVYHFAMKNGMRNEVISGCTAAPAEVVAQFTRK